MLRHKTLDDKATALGIEPDGEPIECDLPHRVAHARKVFCVVGDLVIGNEKGAIIFVLQLDPILERPA